MKRILFYILRSLAFCSRMFSHRLYMTIIIQALKLLGVKFTGRPEYIDNKAHIDASGGLTIAEGVVTSVNVIILTHDWSFLKRVPVPDPSDFDKKAYRPVSIGQNSFIGAGAIVLPGTTIGRNCIIGAGAVVKGNIEDYSIVIGNPAKVIGTTKS